MTVQWNVETCALHSCGHFHEFTVQHPYQGEIDVCRFHAKRMSEAFDGLEVEL